MEKFKLAKTKFTSLVSRAFDKFIELYLIRCYLDDQSLKNASFENFMSFDYDDSEIHRCIKAFQLSKDSDQFEGREITELDKAINEWFKENEITLFRNYFIENRVLSKDEFIKFYGDDNQERSCEYCNISEREIESLLGKGLIYTKRLSTRGLSMEIDRIEPNKGYVEGNIVLCCYWCNNAKTDEFNKNEFGNLGREISKIWNNRFKDIQSSLPNPFCFNKSKIKAFVLGADPTNFSNHGKTVYLDTVFGIGSGDHRYFEGILKNLKEIGLGLEDIYVQNLVQEYLPNETSKQKDWERYAENWLPITRAEFDEVDNLQEIPVLVTAERIMRFLCKDVPLARDIYEAKVLSPMYSDKLGREVYPFYRHYSYSLAKSSNDKFRNELISAFMPYSTLNT